VGEPDRIVNVPQQPIFKHVSLVLALIVDFFILYSYIEALFGEVTQLERYITLAMNGVWLAVNTAQWTFIFKFYRLGGLNLTNFILNIKFKAPQNPSLAYELVYICTLAAPLICPFVPYPLLVFTSWYFPGTLHMLNSGADALAASLLGNSSVAAIVVRHAIYVVISIALVDGCINQGILIQWLFCFLCTVQQYVQTMLTTDSATEENRILDSGLWIIGNSSPSSFLKIRVLYSAYHQLFDIAFASEVTNCIIVQIFSIFLLVCSAEFPAMVTFTVTLWFCLFMMAGFILFDHVTQSHISVQKLIVSNRKKYRRCASRYEYKFWVSMKPPVSSILGLCTFETQEFLLIIWANVVLNSVISLLLAF